MSDEGVANNIDTGKYEWSEYPEEQEVLILPNFSFTVLNIIDDIA